MIFNHESQPRHPPSRSYDVVRLVRERHPTLMLPVILVSANSREEHVVEGLQVGHLLCFAGVCWCCIRSICAPPRLGAFECGPFAGTAPVAG